MLFFIVFLLLLLFFSSFSFLYVQYKFSGFATKLTPSSVVTRKEVSSG